MASTDSHEGGSVLQREPKRRAQDGTRIHLSILSVPQILFDQAFLIHFRKSICLTGTNLRYNVTLLVDKVERHQDCITGLGWEGKKMRR